MKTIKKSSKVVVKVKMASAHVVQPVAVKVQISQLPRVDQERLNPATEPSFAADSFNNWYPEQTQFVAAATGEWVKDLEVGLGRLSAPIDNEPAEAIVCSGGELCSVLAELRRQGRRAAEPVLDGPNRWLVHPGSASVDFTSDLYAESDSMWARDAFSQEMEDVLAD